MPPLLTLDCNRVTGGGRAESLPLAAHGSITGIGMGIGMLGGEGGINGGINGGGGTNAAGWGALEWGEGPKGCSLRHTP